VFIQHLKINQFRNYQNADVALIEGINIFYGDNAQGKTNLLESLYIAAYGKSFRSKNSDDLILEHALRCSVEVAYSKNYTHGTVKAIFERPGQRFLYANNLQQIKRVDYIGHIHVVLFSPEDLRLVKEGPQERRLFIDRELSHINKVYLDQLMKYNKVLKQRNTLLKTIKNPLLLESQLEVWDNQLVYYGARIIVKRQQFIQRINALSRLIHKKITLGKEQLEILYESSIDNEMNDLKTIEAKLLELVKKAFDHDLKRGFTTVGPHRDDLAISINQIDTRRFGSQGQQRTAALSLKLSELEIIKDEIGEYPILLLDDVMSELDQSRQHFLLETIKNIQTILTTTDIKGLDERYLVGAQCILIQSGHLVGGRNDDTTKHNV
jgi:DNA replication and repair protein RecF